MPDTSVPIQPATWCRFELSLRTGPANDLIPIESKKASAKTIDEWPSENQNPTLRGRLPSDISFRVVLSIAEM